MSSWKNPTGHVQSYRELKSRVDIPEAVAKQSSDRASSSLRAELELREQKAKVAANAAPTKYTYADEFADKKVKVDPSVEYEDVEGAVNDKVELEDEDRVEGVESSSRSNDSEIEREVSSKELSDSDEEDEDEDDDDEALMRELQKIRAERALMKENEEKKEREELERVALSSNPLMQMSFGTAQVKRRFGDDTVFGNTQGGAPAAKKRFVNDMIRSDEHRKFMASKFR